MSGRIVDHIPLDHYTEGPATDSEGVLYFTTLGAGRIMRLASDGKPVPWAECDCPNGQIVLPDGDHLVCDSRLGRVLRFDASGRLIREEAGGACGDLDIRVPNDLVADAEGNFYFTDSVRHDGAVFFVHREGGCSVVARGLDYPNGIQLADGGESLLVAESYGNRILRFRLDGPGKAPYGHETFVELPRHPSGNPVDNLPDGIRIGPDGVLAVAHYGMSAVHLVSPDGGSIRSLDTGMRCTSNVAFLDGRTLAVTGGHDEPGPGGVTILSI